MLPVKSGKAFMPYYQHHSSVNENQGSLIEIGQGIGGAAWSE